MQTPSNISSKRSSRLTPSSSTRCSNFATTVDPSETAGPRRLTSSTPNPGSAWMSFLFVTGYEFETPIPMVTREGVKPFPPTGYRQLDARIAFFYFVTGITPAMAMRVTGIGSQYLINMLDADKHYFDGSQTYKVTLPKGIPEANIWSLLGCNSPGLTRPPGRRPLHAVVASADAGPGPSPGTPGRRWGTTPARS